MSDSSLEQRETTIHGLSSQADRTHRWLRQVDTDDVAVGIAEGAVTSGGILRTSGLGSCVSVVIVDRTSHTGGLIHPMLPTPDSDRTADAGRYVSTSIPALAEEVVDAGASPHHLRAWIVGGATMVDFSTGSTSVGDRNLAEAKAVLASLGIQFTADEIGGSCGRYVRCDLDSGSVSVKNAGQEHS